MAPPLSAAIPSSTGTISADTADGEFTVYDVDNTSIIENSNGGTVSCQGSWSSTGMLSASGSGMLQLQSKINNAGNSLTLSGTGNFLLFGTIMGGTL